MNGIDKHYQALKWLDEHPGEWERVEGRMTFKNPDQVPDEVKSYFEIQEKFREMTKDMPVEVVES